MENFAIEELLKKDLQNTSLLAKLLTEEKGLLEKRNVELLSHTLRKKAELLAAIEKNDALCQKLLGNMGFSADRQGLLAWCKTQDPKIEALFLELQQNLHSCREMNLVNAAIVHRSKLNTGKLLDILKGKTTGSGLYNPIGSTRMSSESRTLGNA